MKKKVGIITINDFRNYGNRLQCYAVQNVLENLGCMPENIYNVDCSKMKKVLGYIKNILYKLLNLKNYRVMDKRYSLFLQFNENIEFSKYKIYKDKFDVSINDMYDSFIVGSDQVWNPNFSGQLVYFLPFADGDKRISLSASIGVNKIEEDKYKVLLKSELEKFKKISVREDAGKKILENLNINKEISVLVDPTMLLNADEWDKVSRKPKQISKLSGKKYILNYFLGNLSEERKKEIQRVATENDCEIINILDKNDPFFVSGPSEFLWLEKNAFLICTDSFHSSVFAILYNRPFIVFNREDKTKSMNSRIETLISKFNLKNREYNGKNITQENLKHDYTEAYKILEQERIKSKKFLKSALDIDE